MKVGFEERPAWSGAPCPLTDEFLLMFLRTELSSPSAAAGRYRKFWKGVYATFIKNGTRHLGGGQFL